MATIASLIVNVAANTTSLIRNMLGADKSVSKFAKGATASLGIVTKALAAAGTAVLGLAGFAVKAAIDFESSFTGVEKTVTATAAEFDALEQGLRKLATTIPVNVNELNRIAEAAGQLGIKQNAIIGFTEVMAQLGVTTNLSANEAATSMAQLANITGLQQDKFGNLGSALVDLGNNLATTEAQILDFGLRIAGAGELAGLTEADILGIGGAMASMGVQSEAGGTAVQKVLNNMTEAVALGGDKLELFAATAGLSALEFAKAYRVNAADAFASFVEGLGRQGDAAFGTLKDLKLSNERVIRSFLSLANAGGTLRESMDRSNTAFEENIALGEEAEKRFDTFASKIQILTNKVMDLAISFGTDLLPAVDVMLKALTGYMERTKDTERATNGLTSALILMLKAMGIFQTGVLMLKSGLSGLMLSVKLVARDMVDFVSVVVSLSEILPEFTAVNMLAASALERLDAESRRLDKDINDLNISIHQDKETSKAFTAVLNAMEAALEASGKASKFANGSYVAFGNSVAAAVPKIVISNNRVVKSFNAVATAAFRARSAINPAIDLRVEGVLPPEGGEGGGGGAPTDGTVPTGEAGTGGGGGGGGGVLFGGGGGGGGFMGGGGSPPTNAPGVLSPFGFFNSQLRSGGPWTNITIVQNSLVNDPRAKEDLRRVISDVMTDVLRSRGTRLQTT